jgi:hypothetical protein
LLRLWRLFELGLVDGGGVELGGCVGVPVELELEGVEIGLELELEMLVDELKLSLGLEIGVDGDDGECVIVSGLDGGTVSLELDGGG